MHLGSDLTSTGKQPAGMERHPKAGDRTEAPVTRYKELAERHAEQVGWPGGGKDFIHPRHPNSEAKRAGNAVQGGGAVTRDYPRGTFSSEPQRRGKSTGFNR